MHSCTVIVFVASTICRNFALNLYYLDPTKLQTRTSTSVQEKTALKIIRKYFDNVDVTVDRNFFVEKKDAFSLQTINDNGKLHIVASTGVAAVWGFNYYLKKYCKGHIGWQNISRVFIPEPLPKVDEFIVSNDRFRYYQNVCTFSYSFVWWNVTQWTEHVDWMALNGINLALAHMAQEAAWAKVYKKIGMTKDEINNHFTGPAFLSWLRMGKINGWAGPLFQSWHDRQAEIQAAVVEQMYNLGIIPVLPAFNGHVPRTFSRIYPNNKFQHITRWNRFSRNYTGLFIDPSDPLFITIGQMFLREVSHNVTLSHVYSADPFIELAIEDMTPDVIENSAKAVFNAIRGVDQNAVWLAQNWMFHQHYLSKFWHIKTAKAFLLAVPKGRMLVLDMKSENEHTYEKYPMYFGRPFIWCMFLNHGGNSGTIGKISHVNKKVYKTRNLQNSTMIGIGLTPEAINNNYVMYDFMLETAWRQKSVYNIVSWAEDYAERRYGCKDTAPAWKSLIKGIYDYKGKSYIYGRNLYALTRLPFLQPVTKAWYSSKSIFNALKGFAFAPRACDSAGFQHDLVDITRQSLMYRAEQIYCYLLRNNSLDATAYNVSINMYLDLLHDMEIILASNDDFTAKSWLTDSRNAATNAIERDNYEFNARNQITMWGPNGEVQEYAAKQWAETFHYYYIPRWRMFLAAALNARVKRMKFKERAIQKDISKKIGKQFAKVKINWLPKKDSIKLSRKLYKKWNIIDLPDLRKI